MKKNGSRWLLTMLALSCGSSSTHPTLVSTAPEAAGANCASGGLAVKVGADTNNNGKLDPTEVITTTYVCNGAAGTAGTTGAAGQDGLKCQLLANGGCPGADLHRIRVINQNLSYIDLSNTNLQVMVAYGVNSGAIASLDHAILTNADLTASYFVFASLLGAQAEKITAVRSRWNTVYASGADFSGADFSNSNLFGVDFAGANLSNANFTGATIENGYFEGADLDGANFTNAIFVSTDYLTGASLKGTNFTHSDLRGADFTNVHYDTALANADVTTATFTGAIFSSSTFPAAFNAVTAGAVDLTSTSLTGVDLSGFNLDGVNFASAVLTGAKFVGATLTAATTINTTTSITGADFTGANMDGFSTNADLTNGKFVNASLRAANLTGAVLTGTDFSHATLFGTVFSTDGGTFTGAHYNSLAITGSAYVPTTFFSGTAPSGALDYSTATPGADFSFINLVGLTFPTNGTGTDFSGDNFTGASLEGIQFSEFNLSGANFTNANLLNARLEGFTSSGLDDPNLTGAIWGNTICVDNSLSDQNAGKTCEGFSLGNGAGSLQ